MPVRDRDRHELLARTLSAQILEERSIDFSRETVRLLPVRSASQSATGMDSNDNRSLQGYAK
jgi:hypothetical protein